MPQIESIIWDAPIRDSRDDEFEREATERATIITDVPVEQTDVIWRDPRVPQIGNLRLRAQARGVKATYVTDLDLDTDDGQIWTLTVESSSAKPPEKPDNPLAEPAEIELTGEAFNRLTVRDVKGKFYRNSAGEIVAPHEVKDGAAKITVTKKLPAVPLPSWLLDYAAPPVVNADGLVLKGRFWPKETLLFSPADLRIGAEQRTGRIRWVPVSFALAYRRGGWEEVLLDQGLNELIEEDGKKFLKPILVGDTGEEEPTQQPVFLDKNGNAYRDDDGRVRAKLKPKEILTIETNDYRKLPFKGILPLR